MRVPFMNLARDHAPLAEDLRAAFERVFAASAFILGEEVARFEADFAEYCGVEHCVGVASGTAALIIMLKAAGIGSGDEVIVPAHTFTATSLAVVHAGAQPVCVEVEPGTGLLDVEAVRAAIGPRTAGILPVHLYGQVCAMDELRALADQAGLAVFEDAAQAHGATQGDRRAGSFGLAGAFSFYPSKNLGALGDGGAICTNDAQLAAVARRLADLGRGPDGVHLDAGFNERLDGLQAAFLSVKLRALDAFNAARRERAAAYRERLDGWVELLDERPDTPCIYHLFPIRVDERDRLAGALAARGIATGVHYPVALPDQPWQGPPAGEAFPVARDWAARELSLPISPTLTEAELDAVCAATRDALSAEPALRLAR